MFQNGNRIYAEVGNYLKHKDLRIIGLMIVGNIEDYEEHPLNNPLDIVVEKDKFFINNRMFMCVPKTMDYAGIKTKLITSRYTNDDQMAIILNNGKSEKDTEIYNKMQEWRDWSGVIAEQVVNMINEQKLLE